MEPNKTAAGQRLFQATISGGGSTSGIDVFVLAGGVMKPYDRTYPVTNASGLIVISIAGTVGNGILSGIQVDSVTAPPTPLPPGLTWDGTTLHVAGKVLADSGYDMPSGAKFLASGDCVSASAVPTPTTGSVIFFNADTSCHLARKDSTGAVTAVEGSATPPVAATIQPKVISGQDVPSPSGGDTNYVAWVGAAIRPGNFAGGSLIGMYNDGHDSAAAGMCQGGGGGNSLCVYSMDAYDKANVANTKFSVINNMGSYGAYSASSCFDGVRQMKSRKIFVLNGKLYAPIFCMNGPAPAAGQPWEAFQSGMIVSPDAGAHWCNYKTYTASGNTCTASNWKANGDNPTDVSGFQWPLADGTNKVTRPQLVDFLCQDNAVNCPIASGVDPAYLYFLATDSLSMSTAVMRVAKTADPMLPANWSVYNAGAWAANPQSATDVGGPIGCCGSAAYFSDFRSFAIWQHPDGFATAPAPWGPWTAGAPVLPARQGFPGPVAGLCPKYDVAGRVTCTVFGAPATDLSIYEEDLGPSGTLALVSLHTCTGSTPNTNCAGIYRASFNTATGPLVVTGVPGVAPDSNTWVPVK